MKKHFNYKAFIMKNLVRLSALLTFSTLVFIVGYILIKGIPHLTPSLFSLEYNSTNVSLMPALISTLAMTLLALLISKAIINFHV